MITFKQFIDESKALRDLSEADQQRYAALKKQWRDFLKDIHIQLERRIHVGGYLFSDDDNLLPHIELEVDSQEDPAVLQFELVPFLVRKLLKDHKLPMTISKKEPPELVLNTLNRNLVRIYFDLDPELGKFLEPLNSIAFTYTKRKYL